MAKPSKKNPDTLGSPPGPPNKGAELVIITGLSGSGKLTALKAFEDLGFYAVDNLPIALVPKFADLTLDSKTQRHSALTIDIREGDELKKFSKIYSDLKKRVQAVLFFWTQTMTYYSAVLVKPDVPTRLVLTPPFCQALQMNVSSLRLSAR